MANAVTSRLIDELRMPNGTPFGDPRGMVDYEALRAAAMGTPYDVEARRNAIAAAMQPAAPAGGQPQSQSQRDALAELLIASQYANMGIPAGGGPTDAGLGLGLGGPTEAGSSGNGPLGINIGGVEIGGVGTVAAPAPGNPEGLGKGGWGGTPNPGAPFNQGAPPSPPSNPLTGRSNDADVAETPGNRDLNDAVQAAIAAVLAQQGTPNPAPQNKGGYGVPLSEDFGKDTPSREDTSNRGDREDSPSSVPVTSVPTFSIAQTPAAKAQADDDVSESEDAGKDAPSNTITDADIAAANAAIAASLASIASISLGNPATNPDLGIGLTGPQNQAGKDAAFSAVNDLNGGVNAATGLAQGQAAAINASNQSNTNTDADSQGGAPAPSAPPDFGNGTSVNDVGAIGGIVGAPGSPSQGVGFGLTTGDFGGVNVDAGSANAANTANNGLGYGAGNITGGNSISVDLGGGNVTDVGNNTGSITDAGMSGFSSGSIAADAAAAAAAAANAAAAISAGYDAGSVSVDLGGGNVTDAANDSGNGNDGGGGNGGDGGK